MLEVLLVEFLVEAFHLSFELLVLAHEQLGLEDYLPAVAQQWTYTLLVQILGPSGRRAHGLQGGMAGCRQRPKPTHNGPGSPLTRHG